MIKEKIIVPDFIGNRKDSEYTQVSKKELEDLKALKARLDNAVSIAEIVIFNLAVFAAGVLIGKFVL